MKINFAQVPHADVDAFGDDSLFGPDDSGEYYYNYVEFGTNPGGTEEVCIVDGCDRIMPIAVENIPELISVLKELYTVSQGLKAAERVQDYVNSDAQGYFTDDHIQYEPISHAASWPFNS